MALYPLSPSHLPAEMAVWKIEEEEVFFSTSLGIESTHKSERRRLEFLASRFLLKMLLPEMSVDKLSTHPSGKPFLLNCDTHFSISHSFPYVAVAIGDRPVGIDVQVFHEKIKRIQPKFLSSVEQQLLNGEVEEITLAWTAKEAVFKWFGEGQVDFKRQMPIRSITTSGETVSLEIEFRRTCPNQTLVVTGGVEAEFAWSVL